MTNAELLTALKARFPELGTDDELDACDAVDTLVAWHAELIEMAADDATQAESELWHRKVSVCGFCGESPCLRECVKTGDR